MRNKGGPHLDADWLRQKYWDEGMTIDGIADEAGVSYSTVRLSMDNRGVERRTGGNPGPHQDERWLREMYHGEGLTQYEMADRAGVHRTVIAYNMRRFGIETREVAGENHGKWQGGMDGNFRLTDRWQGLRRDVYDRDNHECQDCGAADCEVHAHHIQPVSDGGAKFDMDNVITLCVDCHNARHNGGD